MNGCIKFQSSVGVLLQWVFCFRWNFSIPPLASFNESSGGFEKLRTSQVEFYSMSLLNFGSVSLLDFNESSELWFNESSGQRRTSRKQTLGSQPGECDVKEIFLREKKQNKFIRARIDWITAFRCAHPYLSVSNHIFLMLQYLCQSSYAHPYPIIFLMLARTTSDLGSKCILLSSEGRVIHNTMVSHHWWQRKRWYSTMLDCHIVNHADAN